MTNWGFLCSVTGTNFVPYVKLLSDKALGIPFAVITDEDPRPEKECLAAKRVRSIVTTLFPEYDYSEATRDLFAEAEEDGVFVTDYTLEVALFRCGRHKSVTSAIEQLSSNSKAKERAKAWRDDTSSLERIPTSN